MVDFRKLAADNYAAATPEERARIDAYREREARYDATRRELLGNFTRYGGRMVPDGGHGRTRLETYVIKDWTAPVEMRIEDGGYGDRKFETLRFFGGPTGNCSFEISEDFVRILREDMPVGAEGRFFICGGSVKYDACWIDCAEVIDYLREFGPSFFPEVTPKPEPARVIPPFLRR